MGGRSGLNRYQGGDIVHCRFSLEPVHLWMKGAMEKFGSTFNDLYEYLIGASIITKERRK